MPGESLGGPPATGGRAGWRLSACGGDIQSVARGQGGPSNLHKIRPSIAIIIPSNGKRCEIVVKKRLAPGKAEQPNEGFPYVFEGLQDRCSCMVTTPCVQLQNARRTSAFVSFREPGARRRIGMCKDVLVMRFVLAAGLLPQNS